MAYPTEEQWEKHLSDGRRGKCGREVLIVADSKSGIRKLSKLARSLGWRHSSNIGVSPVTGDWYRWFKRRRPRSDV